MKKLILILAATGLLASCSNVFTINGESYDLSRLQTTGVDSVIVAFDPLFSFQDVDGNVVLLSTSDEMIVMKKGIAEDGSVRYYAIR